MRGSILRRGARRASSFRDRAKMKKLAERASVGQQGGPKRGYRTRVFSIAGEYVNEDTSRTDNLDG